MPKVLRIINRLNLGGPTYNTALLTRFLEPEYETMLVSGVKLDFEESSEFIVHKYGIKPFYVNDMHRSLNPIRDYKTYLELRRIIRKYKPDIVHTHAAKSGALGRLAAYHENIPIILHTFHGHVFHSYFNKMKSWFYIIIERLLAKISTKIIAISPLQKQELVENYNLCKKNKITVIPLGFDLQIFQKNMEEKRKLFRKKYSIKDDEIAVGIIGRLTSIKNHRYFLNMLKLLLEQTNNKIRAFIIGDGEDRAMLESYAKQLDISYTTEKDVVHDKELCFTSWEKEIDKVNAGLDIVTLTSLNEGTPVSLIEAQAANNPIVATNVGGISDILIENETGLLADRNDFIDFAKQLNKMIDDKTLRDYMTQKGFNFVNTKFGYLRLIQDMKGLYNKLMSEYEISKTNKHE